MGGDYWLLIHSARALLGPQSHWPSNSSCITAGCSVQAQPAAGMAGLPAFAHPVVGNAAAICALRRSTESLHSTYRQNQDPTTSGALGSGCLMIHTHRIPLARARAPLPS
jgi:hypothetical protein